VTWHRGNTSASEAAHHPPEAHAPDCLGPAGCGACFRRLEDIAPTTPTARGPLCPRRVESGPSLPGASVTAHWVPRPGRRPSSGRLQSRRSYRPRSRLQTAPPRGAVNSRREPTASGRLTGQDQGRVTSVPTDAAAPNRSRR
jgi:hypothetical protein